jgi:hypothetical protein
LRPGAAPPPGHHHDVGREAAAGQRAALEPVDHVRNVRVREREQQASHRRIEHHPRDLPDAQRDRVRGDRDPIDPRFQAPARVQRQDQGDEEEDPPVRGQDAHGTRELAVELAQEQDREEREARPGHQHAAPAVGPAAPGDQAAGGERSPDKRQDDLDARDRCLAIPQNRPQRDQLGDDDRDPQHREGNAAGAGGAQTGDDARTGRIRWGHHNFPRGQADHRGSSASGARH